MVQHIMRNDGYCALPFNHMNLHPNGNVSICCVSKMGGPDSGFAKDENGKLLNLRTHTINEIFDAPSVNKIREQMLNGEFPSACEGCYKIEQYGGKSRRTTENTRWPKRETPGLEFIDLRLSNLCNLKCLMCYPDSSSALVTDYNEWADSLPFVTKNNTDFDNFQWFNEDIIDQLKEHKDTLKYLYINGGEPFIMPMQWKMLEKLIEWDVAKNIHISYNTNCTTYSDSFSEYWKHFKVVTLGCSVDATGDKNSFIRYPSKWDVANENIRKLLENPYIHGMNITCSIQWLNAPFLPEFYDWAVPLTKLKPHTTINQNFIVFPDYLSLNCASKQFKQDLSTVYEESQYRDYILTETMKSYLRFSPDSSEQWNNGNKYLDVVQLSRKMGSWKDIFDYDYRF